MMRPILYISPGLFSFGGIARYGQHQVRALREIVGPANVCVASMHPSEVDDMQPDFTVDIVGAHDAGVSAKARFVRDCYSRLRPRAIVWSGHVNYAHVAVLLAKRVGGIPVVNIYGREVWSGLSRMVQAAVRQCWVVSDCYSTRDHAVGMGIASPGQSAVIWDPVDTERFTPGKCPVSVLKRYRLRESTPFRVLFLARLEHATYYKGAERLIDAFAQAELPAGSELVIAGAGDALPHLHESAVRHGISHSTIFTDRVSEEDLGDLYRAADVFVLVSQKSDLAGEGVPLTPLEAGACEVALIVGDEDGSREAVVPNLTGHIVSARGIVALRRALEALAADASETKRMAQASRAYIARNFNLEGFTTKHRDVIARMSA